eukprot:6713384-Prorocentrum_lima.AAC.1
MAPNDCKVERLTEKHDMTTLEGMKHAIKVISKAPSDRILFWASIPCTGGSTWQYINMANYRKRNDTEAIKRL